MRIQAQPGTPGAASGTVVKILPPRSTPPFAVLRGRIVVCDRPGEGVPPIPKLLEGLREEDRPSAFLLDRSDPETSRALARARLPMVSRTQPQAFLEGDRAMVDGGAGWVELPEVSETKVITAMLQAEDGKVLLLKRSEKVGSFQGRWAGVSGFLEDSTPLERAYIELQEEVGLEKADVRLLREGDLVYARDRNRMFTVHPFLFAATHLTIRIDWEHTEFRWVLPSEIPAYATVPGLDRVLDKLALGNP